VQVLLEWIGRATLQADADEDKTIIRPVYPRWAPQNRPWVGSRGLHSGSWPHPEFGPRFAAQNLLV